MNEDRTLTTPRLVLRKPEPSDAEAFMTFYATERARFVGGPMTAEEAWRFFGTEIGHWDMRGYGMYTLTCRGDDTPRGIVGHWYPHGWPETEVGWILFDPADEGKGYATEAAAACVDFAWRVLDWTSVVSYVAPENSASIRVAERLGAVLDTDAARPRPERPCLVYRHPAPERLQ